MMNKTDYRIYAKNIRQTLDIQSLSASFVEKIKSHHVYLKSKNIMVYYPIKDEIDLRKLFNDDKNFFLPKIFGEKILACPLTQKLEISKFKIMEPCSDSVDPNILDLVITPALMADKECYRLGYGGGFYDKFLPLCKNAYKLIVIPKQLLVDKLPRDNFDVKVDEVIYI